MTILYPLTRGTFDAKKLVIVLLFSLFFNCLGLKFHAELLIKAQHICLFPFFDNFAI